MGHLVEATNIAYDERETRGFMKRRGLALLLTIGAVIFVLTAVGIMTVLPAVIAQSGLGVVGRVVVGIARWVLLLVG